MLTAKTPPHSFCIKRQPAHSDSEGVAVGDFIVYDRLDVDGLQLEVNGDVDQPVDGKHHRIF